jgi:hypothetical protein
MRWDGLHMGRKGYLSDSNAVTLKLVYWTLCLQAGAPIQTGKDIALLLGLNIPPSSYVKTAEGNIEATALRKARKRVVKKLPDLAKTRRKLNPKPAK